MVDKILAPLLLLLALATGAAAQPSPGPGPVPGCPISGCTFTGKVIAAPPTGSFAMFNFNCVATAPSSPVNGDTWCITGGAAPGLYVRVGSTTVGPLIAGSGTITGLSVATVNGFNGTVTTSPGPCSPTTPCINIGVSLGLGLVKSNGGGVLLLASAGTDYLTPTGSGAGLTGITSAQVSGLGTLATQNAPTGSVQCLHASAVGAVTGTGVDCGAGTTLIAGGGSPTPITSGSANNLLVVNGAGTALANQSLANLMLSPPAIGGTTPNSVAATNLSSSGTVSGTGFSAYLASPPSIGSSAAGSGAFTSLSASGAVSGAGFTALFASPPNIGSTAPATVNASQYFLNGSPFSGGGGTVGNGTKGAVAAYTSTNGVNGQSASASGNNFYYANAASGACPGSTCIDPSGTYDSTAGMTALFASLPATGGHVYPCGTYTLSAAPTANALVIGNGSNAGISSKQGIKVEGCGAVNIAFYDFLSSSGFVIGAGTVFNCSNCGNIISILGPLNGWGLKNLFLNGNPTNGPSSYSLHCITPVSASNGVVENVAMRGCNYGVYSDTIKPSGCTTTTSFTGAISGTTLTVTSLGTAGSYPRLGQVLSGTGIGAATYIVSGTGGSLPATYTISASYSIISEAMTAAVQSVYTSPACTNLVGSNGLGFLASSMMNRYSQVSIYLADAPNGAGFFFDGTQQVAGIGAGFADTYMNTIENSYVVATSSTNTQWCFYNHATDSSTFLNNGCLINAPGSSGNGYGYEWDYTLGQTDGTGSVIPGGNNVVGGFVSNMGPVTFSTAHTQASYGPAATSGAGCNHIWGPSLVNGDTWTSIIHISAVNSFTC